MYRVKVDRVETSKHCYIMHVYSDVLAVLRRLRVNGFVPLAPDVYHNPDTLKTFVIVPQ